MKDIEKYNKTIFDGIKHIDENGYEYWEARELQKVLNYSQWRRFESVINKAMIACNLSNNKVEEHFAKVGKPITGGHGNIQIVGDYKLSRYGCYLIVQNGDPKKEVIALGQTYFAVKTRSQELTEEEFANLSEEERRLYTRITLNNKNKKLFHTAKNSGVKNFGKFNNYGYRGLYNGETAKDIANRKKLDDKEDILDWMESEELGANLFRITQTEAKLKKDKIDTEYKACDTHYIVGKTVRKAIEELGGTMPENLPTPSKSIKELEKEELLKLINE